MTSRTMTPVLLVASLATAGTTWAAPECACAVATLENGASIGFAMLRTGRAPAGDKLGEAALVRSNGVSRVLWDRQTGAYFGYRVDVTLERGSRPFRVVFRPLEAGALEAELRQMAGTGAPAPTPLAAAAPHYPAPQSLAEGEALTLELLANPDNGEKILDVIKVSREPLAAEMMVAAVGRAREGWDALRRAEINVARNNLKAAVADYQSVIAIQPNDPVVHNLLGICYQRLGQTDDAHRSYRRALELRPDYAQVWNNIGTLEQSRRRFKQAARDYKRAIERNPALVVAWKNLANAYLAMDQIDEGLQAFREAYRIDPKAFLATSAGVPGAGVNAGLQGFLVAKILASQGQAEAALEQLKRAREAGFKDFWRVRADPDFSAVVALPAYRELGE